MSAFRAKAKLLPWFPIVLYSSLIFIASSGPPPVDVEPPFAHADKCVHLLAYVLWALLFIRPLNLKFQNFSRRKRFILASIAGSLYGMSDEFHQSFVPGRSAEILDFCADALGSLIGSALYFLRGRAHSAKG